MSSRKQNYIDGFTLPIPRSALDLYMEVASQVAEVWKDYEAKEYFEYLGDDMVLEGTRHFPEFIGAREDEVVVFGWVVFESREARDFANEKVANDPRMVELIEPLVRKENVVFDAKRMVYGGFTSLV